MRILISLIFMVPVLLIAQNTTGKKIKIRKAQAEIVLDGVIDEPDWQSAEVAKDWYLNFPVDTVAANFQTEARLTFNDEFFYVSFVCYDDTTPDIINSLRRDFIYPLNDNVAVILGPYNDFLNGFFFTITPKGVQMEGTLYNGGTNDAFNTFWDNKWYSEVVRYEDKWVVEMAIPFKSFRYKSELKEWNIAFDRNDRKRNQKSAWIQTPIQFNTGSFAFSGQLVWEDPVPPARTNISVIPYVAGNRSIDKLDPNADPQSDLQVGFDSKISITPSINLDLTVNPDFSQVEVDRQVINLTRFEVQFPERRQFFLENSDLFDQLGFPGLRPFFSRRIGLVRDSSGLFRKIPILYGARLSGSLNEKWRMSFMNMQTKEDLSIGLPAQNYSVATVQRNLFQQSSLAISLVNKESLGISAADSAKFFHPSIFRTVFNENGAKSVINRYNRVVSADLELRSKDNKWYHSSYIGKSLDVLYDDKSFGASSFWRYSTQNIDLFVGNTIIQENYNAEVGFVPSQFVYPGQYGVFGQFAYKHFPKNESIIFTGPSFMFRNTWVPEQGNTDQNYSLSYNFNFKNTAALSFDYGYTFQKLTFNFNPTGQAQYDRFLAGEEYNWSTFSASYQSDSRKTFNYALTAQYGGLYNGNNLNISGQLNARYQPYGNVSLVFDYNDLKLPGNYGEEKFFLIGPRIDLTLTDAFFLTTYFQYNSLLDNVNLNARFQWRYKPASDFFIVYTENYFPEDFRSKNRALVFKMTYWINL